jgi:AAA domain (dynein-related subfamily)
MNTEPLQSLIKAYFETCDTDPIVLEQGPEHQRRVERAARLLTPEHIPYLTVEEWVEFLKDTDAARGNPWDSNSFWRKQFPEGSTIPAEMKENLLRLIRDAEEGLTPTTFNEAIAALPHIGPAYLSEILALCFPDRYWILNKVVRDALAMLGVDLKEELPRGKKGDEGEMYMAAGRHLAGIRTAMQAYNLVMREPRRVDFMETDLFLYWMRERQGSDIWRGKIAGILREEFPTIRDDFRENSEGLARDLIERNLGSFDTDAIRELFRELNSDVVNETARYNRFMPALYGSLANKIANDTGAFNRWLEILWTAQDNELDAVLDEFWEKLEVRGAGISLPTAILYLRNPERYAIWLPIMQEGLRVATSFTPGKFRTAKGYRLYNDAAQKFRARYGLVPQALDLVLWSIAKEVAGETIEGVGVGDGSDGGDDGGGTVIVTHDGQHEAANPRPAEVRSSYTYERFIADTFMENRFLDSTKALLTNKRQVILYGPPGTGKTWIAKKFAEHWVDLTAEPDGESGEMQVVQFHPSYSYEEFVEGIRPRSIERSGGGFDISYDVRPGVFRVFCEEATRHPRRNYVLILDEINRGEIARIFGELLYLLEYRDESVVLPYSGERFSVPRNLYIVGTMNSADRSIALVDHALRRRFHFVEMRPSADTLRAYHERHGTGMAWTGGLLEEVNSQLVRDGIEWHLHVGHSHLMSRDLDETLLQMVWKYSVLPTLAEYFYGRDDLLQNYTLDTLKVALRSE